MFDLPRAAEERPSDPEGAAFVPTIARRSAIETGAPRILPLPIEPLGDAVSAVRKHACVIGIDALGRSQPEYGRERLVDCQSWGA
jgi:hypothetical protein